MRIASIACLLITLASISGCARDDSEKPVDAKGVAEAQGRLAATPEQAKLWDAAARSGAAQGVQKAPMVENPVVPRPRVSVQDRKAQIATARLAADATDVHILSAPELPGGAFEGSAKVLQAEGDRLELDLGNQRILSLQARVGGRALRAKADEFGRVDLRLGGNPRSPREIVAVRLPGNDGMLSVLETGREPVVVKVPLFELIAQQVGKPEAHTMAVEVRVGSESRVLAQGQRAEFPARRLVVLLISSTAYTGPAAEGVEGMPFGMQLIGWSTN